MSEYPRCKTCQHWDMWDPYDPEHPAYVEGHVDPVRGDCTHDNVNTRTTQQDFGCVFHSALQDDTDQ